MKIFCVIVFAILSVVRTGVHKVNSLNQETRILKALKAAGSRGLTTWEMIKLVPAEYRARVTSLRHDGYNIVAERVVVKGRYVGYWRYTLIEERLREDER